MVIMEEDENNLISNDKKTVSGNPKSKYRSPCTIGFMALVLFDPDWPWTIRGGIPDKRQKKSGKKKKGKGKK